MLKSIARFILRNELAQIYSDSRLQQLFLDQWKLSSEAWEKYAKKYVPADAPSFSDWFFRELPKPPPSPVIPVVRFDQFAKPPRRSTLS